MSRDKRIDFPLTLRSQQGRTAIRCSEGVHAAWNTAVAGLGTRSELMLRAYLREAIVESAREAKKSAEQCVSTLGSPEREAAAAILETAGSEAVACPNTWLLLRATFEAIRSAYDGPQ